MPLVSVIVPIYNVEPYLRRCIDSALAQSFSDFELILVDDGSPDNCGAICDEYAAKDSRIVVIHQQNGGLSAARNVGMNAATGTFIYFLDGDDSIQPELLETVLPHMNAGADLVVFRWNDVYSDGREVPSGRIEIGTFLLSQENRLTFLIEKLLTYKIGWEAWNRIFRRDLIEKYRLRFADNKVIFAEDLYFSLCYCAHAEKIVSIPNALYRYLLRDDSIMGQNRQRLNAGRMNELAKAVLQHYSMHDDCKELVQHFPAIHYLIIEITLSRAVRRSGITLPELREQLRGNISDWNFYSGSMKRLAKHAALLGGLYPAMQLGERVNTARYLADGNYTALRIRNRILYKLIPRLEGNRRWRQFQTRKK